MYTVGGVTSVLNSILVNGFYARTVVPKYPNNEAMCSGLYSMLELLRKCTVMAGAENLGAEEAITPSLCKVEGKDPPPIIN